MFKGKAIRIQGIDGAIIPSRIYITDGGARVRATGGQCTKVTHCTTTGLKSRLTSQERLMPRLCKSSR
jgi:hypothetical protein